MKINEHDEFIVLDYDISNNIHKISFHDDIEKILSSWGPNTRISPIWRLTPTVESPPPKRKRKRRAIAFLGPINPVALEDEFGPEIHSVFKTQDCWISLGFFNLIVALSSDEELDILREFSIAHGCASEFWGIESSSGEVAFIEAQQLPEHPHPSPQAIVAGAPVVKNPTVASHILELRTLMSAADGRGSSAFPWIASDLGLRTLAHSKLVSFCLQREMIAVQKQPGKMCNGRARNKLFADTLFPILLALQ